VHGVHESRVVQGVGSLSFAIAKRGFEGETATIKSMESHAAITMERSI
jgi:hypothetical protein